jgi:soluble lytic murein transglycosylase-like protein
MARRRKQAVWKKQLRRAAKKTYKGALKLMKVAFKRLWRLPKQTWKAWHKKRRGRRQQPEPLMVPTSFMLSIATVFVVGALIMSQGEEQVTLLDTPCALREQVSNPDIQQRWPEIRQWCPLITQAGASYQLDPHLIAAVMWVESAGNPQAYSHSGAVGLMQVMPRDGLAAGFRCPAGPCFADRPSIAELQDPAFNVDYGVALLASNIARRGSWRDGLRAYGPKDAGYSYADMVLGVYEQIKN